MTLVIDASVAVKWVLEEEDSEEARALLGAEPAIAPEFLLLECANVLAQQVRRGRLTPERSEAGLRIIQSAGVQLRPTHPFVSEARRLAVALGQSAYDCVYLAAAIAEGAVVITADRRFAQAVQPSYASAVRLL